MISAENDGIIQNPICPKCQGEMWNHLKGCEDYYEFCPYCRLDVPRAHICQDEPPVPASVTRALEERICRLEESVENLRSNDGFEPDYARRRKDDE